MSEQKLKELIGDISSNCIHQASDDIQLQRRRYKKNLVGLLAVVFATITLLTLSLWFIPKKHRNDGGQNAIGSNSANATKLVSYFESPYSKTDAISRDDYQLARKHLLVDAETVNYSKRCVDDVCTEYLTTNQLRIKFVTHNGNVLYVVLNEL